MKKGENECPICARTWMSLSILFGKESTKPVFCEIQNT